MSLSAYPDFFSTPLVTNIYTADASAHVFNNQVYVYPSHDRETNGTENDNGDFYDMIDYHILSLPTIPGPVTDNGVALSIEDIPWVSKQLWAPDAATKDGKFYLYFPAKDHDSVFRIGVAVSDSPVGPFTPDPEPIPGSYSIDPASFVDDDGQAYLYFGGIWGGQLQCWDTGEYVCPSTNEPSGSGPALKARVAKLGSDMRSFETEVRQITILDEAGNDLIADDHDRRFFEGAWVFKRYGKYYFVYSTGDTHYMVYAIGDSPWGPFTYAGRVLEPVVGWTTHGSIVEFGRKWYLFYHDSALSGKDYLRNVRVREIYFDRDGKILLDPPADC